MFVNLLTRKIFKTLYYSIANHRTRSGNHEDVVGEVNLVSTTPSSSSLTSESKATFASGAKLPPNISHVNDDTSNDDNALEFEGG